MNLTEFISSLSPADSQALQERLDVLSRHNLGRQFVINLKAEARFTIAIWQTLHQTFLNASPDPDSLRTAFIDAFRPYILNGGSIPTPWPTHYGRATPENIFADLLVKQGKATSRTAAKRFLRNLMSKSLPIVQQRLAHKEIGQYMIWATFNEDNPNGDPFEKLPDDAEGIRAGLGLDPNYTGDMILLTYYLPVGVEPLYPTVADGYSSGWNYYYRPSYTDERYGRTLCWLGRADVSPCPEVVHKPVTGDCLLAPIAKAKEKRI